MKDKLIQKIKILKKELQKEGFIIDAIFGSFVKSEKFNDIDLLYHLDKSFFEKYNGFVGFKKLEEIKEILKKELKYDIDLAPIDNLSKTAKKYIKDIIYV